MLIDNTTIIGGLMDMRKFLIRAGMGLGLLAVAGVASAVGGVLGGLAAAAALSCGDGDCDGTFGCCGCGRDGPFDDEGGPQEDGAPRDEGDAELSMDDVPMDPAEVCEDGVTPGLGFNQVDADYI